MQGKYINCYKNLAFGRKLMYKSNDIISLDLQISISPPG